MKPQKRPFAVEIKHSRRSQKSAAGSIWGDVDLTAYELSDIDPEVPAGKPEVPADLVTAELEAVANKAASEGTILNREPPAPSSVGLVKANGLYYVRVYDNGAKHELIGPFRTREQAQAEAAKWIKRFKSEPQQ
ncbi:hypothetical protein LJR231_006101 [Phyllobacterium sp. LjRoot231]|uniref:hypothetical protein n=1 Tax=Phyllobacterium sp. LjRoot231 TaxID=3342289 RepID=UPI003ECE3F54